jgi:hypothetical protein
VAVGSSQRLPYKGVHGKRLSTKTAILMQLNAIIAFS